MHGLWIIRSITSKSVPVIHSMSDVDKNVKEFQEDTWIDFSANNKTTTLLQQYGYDVIMWQCTVYKVNRFVFICLQDTENKSPQISMCPL